MVDGEVVVPRWRWWRLSLLGVGVVGCHGVVVVVMVVVVLVLQERKGMPACELCVHVCVCACVLVRVCACVCV